MSRQTLYDILDERQDVTSGMALRLGKLTETSAEVWSRMQQAVGLARAEVELAAELDKIPTLRAADHAERLSRLPDLTRRRVHWSVCNA